MDWVIKAAGEPALGRLVGCGLLAPLPHSLCSSNVRFAVGACLTVCGGVASGPPSCVVGVAVAPVARSRFAFLF